MWRVDICKDQVINGMTVAIPIDSWDADTEENAEALKSNYEARLAEQGLAMNIYYEHDDE